MLIRFTKMHGLGNDFMVIDLVTQRVKLSESRVRKLADRHTGVGFDQLLLVEPPQNPNMDFRYRIYNADGSEVENCGNGARCFARFVSDKRLTSKETIRVETAKGSAKLKLLDRHMVEVNMGAPILEPLDIPFSAAKQAVSYSLALDGNNIDLSAVSMGNPHGVLVVDDIDQAPVAELGPKLEKHPSFPEKANIGFMQVVSPSEIHLRVFERGAGETQACGTGACAAVVAGISRGLLDTEVKVQLPGGELFISWGGKETDSVIMTGSATTVYEGQVFI